MKKPGTILVVDDDRAVRQGTAEGLRRAGYRVIEASSGKDALAAIDKEGGVAIYDYLGTQTCRIETKVLKTNDPVLQFNDDGSVLLIKADDSSVRLVEVPSGRELRRLTRNNQPSWLQTPASFSSDGKNLIAGKVIWGVE